MKKFKNSIANFLRLFVSKPKDFSNTPIFINNFNRLTTLKQLILSLEIRGYHNITILDNNSTYPPLLEFYKTTDCKVHRFKKNYGSKSFWKSGLWLKYTTEYFVYTDPDVVPVEDCPEDFIAYFYELLQKHSKVHKVGFSLKIDDLPDTFANKNKVIEWEKKFYEKSIDDSNFLAPIDTTFALYRPFSKSGKRDGSTPIIRTGFPYQARHLPWYVDNENLDDEEEYYLNSIATRTHWARQNKT